MTITSLPQPSKAHATCAWCRAEFPTIGALLLHVDGDHLEPASATTARAFPLEAA